MRRSLMAVVVLAGAALFGGSAIFAAETAPLASFELSALPDGQFDKEAWSAPSEDGGVKFRTALKGKSGGVKLKAWWQEGSLRPAEGAHYILEVKFKDVFSKPADVLSFSGIGWGFIGQTHLHSIGGAHDGQWKTANVPVPWDMIGRLVNKLDESKNAPEMALISFRSGEADLPVASITVRNALPQDEPRFYAECRAQIAREQAEARAKTPLPKAKETAATGTLTAYPWDAGCRMFPYNPVPAGAAGKPVQIRMCLDELEPGSFGVFASGAPLTGVDYEITPLKNAAGETLKAAVERRTAEYSLLDGKWTPMRLWQAYPVDVPEGCSQWFYFNLETKRGEAKAGKYTGKILISAKEGKTELPLEVEVLPIDLLTMDEAGLTMTGDYDVMVPLHDIDFEKRYNYGGLCLWYQGFSVPLALKDGKLAFDFTYVDDWMIGARKRGFSKAVWYLGGDPFHLAMTAKVFRHLGTLDGKMTIQQWAALQTGKDKILPEARKLFVEWMREVNQHALDNNWPELLPTPHDEPMKYASVGPWVKSFFKDGCAAIREADPRIRIYGCIHHVKNWKGVSWDNYIDDLQIYCTNAIFEDMDVGNKVRNAGKEALKQGGKDKELWQYCGLGGGVPESQRYSFGFFYGAFGSTGFGSWAYSWGPAWDLSGRRGDLAVTAWPTVYETIPSPWFEGQREGFDDRRIIETYKKRFAHDAAAMKVLDDIFAQVRSSRSKHSGNNTETGFFDSVDDTAKLNRWRTALLDKLTAAAE